MILLQIDEWFSAGLAGIRQTDDSVAFKEIVIKPQAVGTLTHVAGDRQTPYGSVETEWKRDDSGITSMDVTIPAGTTATVYVPAAEGQSFVTAEGKATAVDRVDGYQVFEVEPGKVSFVPDESALAVHVTPRTLAGKVYLSVEAANRADVAADITVTTEYGKKTFKNVAPGKSVAVSVNSRLTSVPAGEATVTSTRMVDGEAVTETDEAAFGAYPTKP
jgi:hypothetical protein